MTIVPVSHTSASGSRVREYVSIGRGWFIVASICALLFCGAIGAFADPIRVIVNGDRVRFEDVGPQQINGRVLVPVRGVLEKLGANVSWQPEDQRVIATNGNTTIKLRLGDRRAEVNGRDVMLDVPAQTYSDRTMVPLRFLGEALGAQVRWDDHERTVYITTNDSGHHDNNDQHRPDPGHDNNRGRDNNNPNNPTRH
ncbi:MAG TPA: copper amine oxidase N-terminal domain-containing protein [Chthonomonadaceae bacterium]|nr:copper amine oxidase N-terminal domain-containing protein [Chthonomonadaceae bacterium]